MAPRSVERENTRGPFIAVADAHYQGAVAELHGLGLVAVECGGIVGHMPGASAVVAIHGIAGETAGSFGAGDEHEHQAPVLKLCGCA